MPANPDAFDMRRSMLLPAPDGITECSTLLRVPKVQTRSAALL